MLANNPDSMLETHPAPTRLERWLAHVALVAVLLGAAIIAAPWL